MNSIIIAGLIRLRDNFLNLIAGIEDHKVLNTGNGVGVKNDTGDLAAEIKRALDLIKVNMIDETGANVDYASLRNSHIYREFRGRCSPKLRAFDPRVLGSREQKLAFWINLYNALVLDAVITFGVQHSVTESWLGTLAFFRKAAYNVGGQRLSLDDIEHGILRGNRGHPLLPGPHFVATDLRQEWVIAPPDARIHFALNCASRSCPPIQVYSGEHIDIQLEQATRNFVNETTTINRERRELCTSAIFRWYQGDFGGEPGVVSFILNHLPQGEPRSWIKENQNSLRLDYQPYDWNLNI